MRGQGTPHSWMGVPARMWDRVSSRYDRQLWLERSSVRILLELLAPASHERLLDAATGTGAVLRQLSRRADRPLEAIGVDASTAMLACVPPLPAGWSLRVADARELPFTDGAFDAVTASYLLHALADRDLDAVLGELLRVMRPGGRLAVLTPVIPAQRPLRWLGLALNGLATGDPERFGGLRALDPRAALERAGFEILAARYSVRGYLSICVLARRP
ncbi:MAG: class I SAM-dependent methyltransferase [Solirubrobacteraceae bacterium]